MHKYGAKKTEVDGITFPSKKQADRYSELKLLEKAGEIHSLKTDETHKKELTFELQQPFTDITGKKWRGIYYIADFMYVENGNLVVEDSKGVKTDKFRIKEKLFRYQYRTIDFRLT
jgi:hypothetical protein